MVFYKYICLMINNFTKIYIAGHQGMVGSSVWRALKSKGYSNLIGKTSRVRFKKSTSC